MRFRSYAHPCVDDENALFHATITSVIRKIQAVLREGGCLPLIALGTIDKVDNIVVCCSIQKCVYVPIVGTAIDEFQHTVRGGRKKKKDKQAAVAS